MTLNWAHHQRSADFVKQYLGICQSDVQNSQPCACGMKRLLRWQDASVLPSSLWIYRCRRVSRDSSDFVKQYLGICRSNFQALQRLSCRIKRLLRWWNASLHPSSEKYIIKWLLSQFITFATRMSLHCGFYHSQFSPLMMLTGDNAKSIGLCLHC